MKFSEALSRLLITAGVLIVVAVPFAARAIDTQGIIKIHARMASAGGWMPNAIQARVGVPLHLRLTSDDVMHGFAVGQSDQPAVDVAPGKTIDLTLTFDKPGTYTFYCTRWCGPDHWRMRGTIEVIGNGPADLLPASSPLYEALGLDIDAAHPAPVTPVRIPDAQGDAGLASWLPSVYRSVEYYRSHSPAQAYLDLRADPALSTFGGAEIWDLVAYLWQANTTSARLAAGQKLFAENCAACHGETGGGNGVFAADINTLTGKTPARFADPVTVLGASPALLQGKILRGGMGTGMPSWGPIFTDGQTWDLVSFLYTFQFKESNQ